MLGIHRNHIKPDLQSGCANRHVLKGQCDSVAGEFTFNATGELAMASVTGYTGISWQSRSMKARRRSRSDSDFAR
jgi:hypothetical protein